MTAECPRCPGVALDLHTRDGVSIDLCPRCRGIWLDRGELEKLLSVADAELSNARPTNDSVPPSSDRHAHSRATRSRKRSLAELLSDVFD